MVWAEERQQTGEAAHVIDVTGNLWEYPADARVITTNGAVRKDGFAVMGRGCAKEAAERYPRFQKLLGREITAGGNRVYHFVRGDEHIVTFPVKHHWRELAEPYLIHKSAHELVQLTDLMEWEKVVMPRPGCGNGGLNYNGVRPGLEPILDDRFHVITYA